MANGTTARPTLAILAISNVYHSKEMTSFEKTVVTAAMKLDDGRASGEDNRTGNCTTNTDLNGIKK